MARRNQLEFVTLKTKSIGIYFTIESCERNQFIGVLANLNEKRYINVKNTIFRFLRRHPSSGVGVGSLHRFYKPPVRPAHNGLAHSDWVPGSK